MDTAELEKRLRDEFCDESCIGHERGCHGCPITEALEHIRKLEDDLATVERERDEAVATLQHALRYLRGFPHCDGCPDLSDCPCLDPRRADYPCEVESLSDNIKLFLKDYDEPAELEAENKNLKEVNQDVREA